MIKNYRQQIIIDYQVVEAPTPDDLEDYVELAIKSGYQPFGNLVIGINGELYQPVVKYADSDE